jgi:putative hydrolase of the HAD superfamily
VKNPITTIAFDYGGVLARRIDDTYLCHMAEAAGAPVDEFIAALWRHRSEYDSGEFSAAVYWQMVIEEAGSRLPRDGNRREETVELLTHLDAFAWSTLNPGMLRWMAALRQEGYRRFLLSNMAPETYDLIIRDRPLLGYLDRVVLSGWLGINKPDREIFLEAARQMEVSPREILFIDDLQHNVEGAREAGLHALRFTGTSDLSLALAELYPAIPRRGLDCC